MCSDPAGPARVSFVGCVLPSGPCALMAGFPNLRRLCPIRHLVSIRLSPACLDAPCTMTPPVPTPFPGSSPSRVPTLTASSSYFIQEPTGLPEFSNVSLLRCQDLRTPADIGTLAMQRVRHVAFQHVKTVGIRISYFEAAPTGTRSLQGTRFPLRPTRFSSVRLPHTIVRGLPRAALTNTRYGRVASPYPTGTYTPQETPSLARRDNVRAKRATTAGRQRPDGENVQRTAGRALVACRWRSA